MTRLPGEVPLVDTIPFERERFHADAEHQGRTLTAELLSPAPSIDHAARAISNAPLFAAAGQAVDRPLWSDFFDRVR